MCKLWINFSCCENEVVFHKGQERQRQLVSDCLGNVDFPSLKMTALFFPLQDMTSFFRAAGSAKALLEWMCLLWWNNRLLRNLTFCNRIYCGEERCILWVTHMTPYQISLSSSPWNAREKKSLQNQFHHLKQNGVGHFRNRNRTHTKVSRSNALNLTASWPV